MSRKQLGTLIDQITKSDKFKQEIRKHCDSFRKQDDGDGQKPTFAFEKASKYPWSVEDNTIPIEGQKAIDDITDMIAGIIDNNMHHVLSRQFLNVTNQILVIRQEINQFTQDQQKMNQKMKQQLIDQIDLLKRKMVVQQNTSTSNQGFFRRTRGTLNTSISSNITNSQKIQSKGQVAALRKEVEMMRQEMKKQEQLGHVTEKLFFIQQKMQNQIITLRMKMESLKQKTQKDISSLTAKLGQNNNKTFIGQQVKRSVKSHLKVYLEEMNKCKVDRLDLHQTIARTDKSLQQYMASQLKPLWLLVQGMKRRQEQLQEDLNMNNQSFVME